MVHAWRVSCVQHERMIVALLDLRNRFCSFNLFAEGQGNRALLIALRVLLHQNTIL